MMISATARTTIIPTTPLCLSLKPSGHSRSKTIQPRLARLLVRAQETEESIAVELPEGATHPKRVPEIPPPLFGFVDFAERTNSRVAMVGFMGIIIVELFANKGILQLIGLKVGSGLGFEI